MSPKSNFRRELVSSRPSPAQLERNRFVCQRVSPLLKELDASIVEVYHTVHPTGAESGVVRWKNGRSRQLSIDNLMDKRAVLAAYFKAAGINLELI